MWNTKCKSHKSAPDTSCQAIDHGYHILDFWATLPGYTNNVCCVETCFENTFLCGSINIDFDMSHREGRHEKSITVDHVADFLPTEKKCLFCLCFVYTACYTDRDWTTCQHTWYPPIRFSTIPFHLHLSGRGRYLFYQIATSLQWRSCLTISEHGSKVSESFFCLHNGKNVMMTSEDLVGRSTGLRVLFAPSTGEKLIGRKMNHFQMSEPIQQLDHLHLINFQPLPRAIHESRVNPHTASLPSVTLWHHTPEVAYIGIERYRRRWGWVLALSHIFL